MPLFTILLAAALASPPASNIEAVLTDFTQGAATRDIARVERALHPEARQFVHMPDGLQVMDRTTYVSLLKAEKIGGTPTQRKTDGIEVQGRRAVVHQVRDVGAFLLHDTVTLVEDDDRWVIVSVAVDVEKSTP